MGTIKYALYPNLGIVHFQGSGTISYALLMAQITALHRSDGFDFTYHSFIDFADARVLLDPDGLSNYHAFFSDLQEAGPRRKWAIYSTVEETLQNANMAHLLLSHVIEVDVFTRRRDALAFLGIDAKDLPEPGTAG